MREPRDASNEKALQAILRYTREREFERATEELVRTFKDDIYGYCFNRLGRNHTDADEVAQKIVIAAWRALPKARFAYGTKSIAPWLYAIAKFKIMDAYKISPEIPVENPPEDPPAGLEPEISELDLKRALMKLDSEEREILLWSAQRFSAKEIAEFLEEKITEEGVRTRIYRAREVLKEILKES